LGGRRTNCAQISGQERKGTENGDLRPIYYGRKNRAGIARKRKKDPDSCCPNGKYLTENRLALAAAAAQDFSRERKNLGEIWVEKTLADFTEAKMEADASAQGRREILGDHRIEGAAKKKRSDLSISLPCSCFLLRKSRRVY
jgi:hypothetical protein